MALHDLLVVGCGPVGAVAANLAGAAGLSTVVVEQAEEVFDRPRAIHFDAHVMRILQQAGVAEALAPETRTWRRSTFRGADGEPIRVHEWPPDRPQGWDAHHLFYQPQLEALLRARLAERPEVSVRLGSEVVELEQDAEAVTVRVQDRATGRAEELRARWVLGADGASSFVRAQAAIGLLDLDFDEPWMVIDLLCDRELGRPDESEMFCDPRRPATRVPGPGRHHRWEFMLLPGETPEEIQRPEAVAELLRPWVAPDEVELLRASVYRFHALVAERWRDGRSFLCGDAAHQTPPFLGQGMCHGIRDVQNLVWKLAAIRDGAAPEELLESYEAERRPHVETIIAMAVEAGREVCLLDPVAAAERDARTRRAAQTGELPRTTFQGMPPLVGGLFTRPGAGELLPQPEVRTRGGRRALLDEEVGTTAMLVAPPALAGELGELAHSLGAAVVTVGDETVPGAVRAPAELAAWLADRGGTCAVVRPDRYVHAIAGDAEEAREALRELCGLLAPAQPATG